MPVGVTLLDLRRDLRAEAGISLNPAQGVAAQDTMDNQLNRQQLELWDAYQWPHLRYWVDKPMMRGQSLYNYPDEMPFDQISRVYFVAARTDPDTNAIIASSDSWKPLKYGFHAVDVRPTQQIGEPNFWNNRVSITNGKTNPAGQMVFLPTPPPMNPGDDPAFGILRFDGQAPLNPMVDNTDVCLLDSKAIVLFAAAEILAVQKVEAATLKLKKAQDYLRRLLQNSGADKRASYNMGGSRANAGRPDHYARGLRYIPGIDYVPS